MAMGHNTHQYQSVFVFFYSFSLSYICEKMLIDDFFSTNETNPGHFAWVGEKFDTLKKRISLGHQKVFCFQNTHTIFESYHGLALIVDKMEL